MTTINSTLARIKPRRKVHGMAAVLLPFEEDGQIAYDAFERHVSATHAAGLTPAINMDTGYANYLTDTERRDILNCARQAVGPAASLVAGVYIENRDGDVVSRYRQQMDEIAALGAMPILFQTARLHAAKAADKIAAYERICRGYPAVLAFELGKMFSPNGEIWDEQTFRGILMIPEIKGAKHSSLDRITELNRLAVRDQLRPDFCIYTGNDLAINMIEYGSDYLLGLATFAPEKFAERDKLWQSGDPAYYALSDALQYLGNVAFRAPVPAYKHSAAVFLHMLDRIPTPKTHPNSLTRPEWEREILRDCARRLDLLPGA